MSSRNKKTGEGGRNNIGLQNLGNTCYMNVIIEIILHYPTLCENVLTAEESRSGVTKELVELNKTLLNAWKFLLYELKLYPTDKEQRRSALVAFAQVITTAFPDNKVGIQYLYSVTVLNTLQLLFLV